MVDTYEYEAGTLNEIWDDFAIREDEVNGRLVVEDGNIDIQFDRRARHYNLQPEGAQTGLAADATGVQYSGEMPVELDASILNGSDNIYIEASENSSAGDETVTVEIYNVTQGTVDTSLDVGGGVSRSRSADISGSLNAGDEYQVRWNVTTASATSGATFDAVAARLVAE